MSNENHTEQQPIWASCGYAPFGFKLPFYKYALYSDCISVTSGLFTQTTQKVPLYRIAAKEISTSIVGRFFRCGEIHLITRGKEIPDLQLSVKDPEKVLGLIEKAISSEQQSYQKKNSKKKKKPYDRELTADN